MFSPAPPANRFASRCYLDGLPVRAHPLNDLLQQAFQTLYLSDDGHHESAFFKQCRTLDATRQQLYLAMPEEMAARAFENLLQRQSLKNSFLVAGTLHSKAAKLGVYPDELLSNALSQLWLPYFRALGLGLTHQR
nr:LPD1 domain-containing protein [Arsukibacterium sp.]